MTNRPDRSACSWNPSAVINTLLAVILIACLSVDLSRWMSFLFQSDFSLLLPFACIAALEAQAMARMADRGMIFTRTWFQISLTEAGVLLLLMKAAVLWRTGWPSAMEEIRRWPVSFWDSFFSTPFVLLCCIVGGLWIVSRMLAADLRVLETRQPMRAGEAVPNLFEDQYRAQRNVSDLIMILGGAIIVFGILAEHVIPSAFHLIGSSQGSPSAPGAALGPEILIFFLCGLGVLSFSRFAIQRSGWEYEGILMGNEVPIRWMKSVIGFLSIITVLAILLPSDYSAVFLAAVLQVALTLWHLAASIVAVILLVPFMLVHSWWSNLFDMSATTSTAIPTPMPESAPPPAAQPSDYIQAVFFWLIVFSITVYVLIQLIRSRKAILHVFSKVRKPNWLVRLMTWVARRIARAGSGLAASFGNTVLALRKRLTGQSILPRWKRLIRAVTPRGRVRAYYLALVRRGAEVGLPRRGSQTPQEYARVLAGQVPGLAEDLKVITFRFQEARYSRHPIGEYEAGQARLAWMHLRRLLKSGLFPSAVENKRDAKPQ